MLFQVAPLPGLLLYKLTGKKSPLTSLLLCPTFTHPIFLPLNRGSTPRPCATVPYTHFSASLHPRAKPVPRSGTACACGTGAPARRAGGASPCTHPPSAQSPPKITHPAKPQTLLTRSPHLEPHKPKLSPQYFHTSQGKSEEQIGSLKSIFHLLNPPFPRENDKP